MSKSDRQKKRAQRRRQGPSAPRVIGANDNAPRPANDNSEPVVIGGITLSPRQAATYRAALANLASDDLSHRREGGQALIELEAELTAELDARHMIAVKAEIAALERARGGTLRVEKARDRRGEDGEQLRVSRDGLETLLTAKSITTIQHAAGLRYRADYELLDPEKGLTPPTIDQTRKIVRGGDGFAAKRREREEFVRDLEAIIQDEDRTFRGPNGRTPVERLGLAVVTLREVAGKGSNIAALSHSGSERVRMADALRLGLDCAAIAYGLE